MNTKILIENYQLEDAQELANIFFITIHRINIKDYTQSQVDVWAPETGLKDWKAKFLRTNPIIAVVNDQFVGFAEFESDGHIDCFYCHHDFLGKGVGSALMKEIFTRAKSQKIDRIFSDVSITAKPFFEKQGFLVIAQQTIVRKGVELKNFKMELRV